MDTPRIALPIPTSTNTAYNDRCWPQYQAALAAAGALAVAFPLTLPPSDAAKLVSQCAGVLLPGSPADVHPQKYGEATQHETAPADPLREATDELLLQDAFHLRKPLLGICFGLQMMNVWRGGSLVQHLRTGHPHAPDDGAPTLSHPVEIAAEAGMLRTFFGGDGSATINSSHHQAVDKPGDGLLIAARSEPDRVVEALESTSGAGQWILGVQWHPERSFRDDPPAAAIFSGFVEAARQWRLPQA